MQASSVFSITNTFTVRKIRQRTDSSRSAAEGKGDEDLGSADLELPKTEAHYSAEQVESRCISLRYRLKALIREAYRYHRSKGCRHAPLPKPLSTLSVTPSSNNLSRTSSNLSTCSWVSEDSSESGLSDSNASSGDFSGSAARVLRKRSLRNNKSQRSSRRNSNYSPSSNAPNPLSSVEEVSAPRLNVNCHNVVGEHCMGSPHFLRMLMRDINVMFSVHLRRAGGTMAGVDRAYVLTLEQLVKMGLWR